MRGAHRAAARGAERPGACRQDGGAGPDVGRHGARAEPAADGPAHAVGQRRASCSTRTASTTCAATCSASPAWSTASARLTSQLKTFAHKSDAAARSRWRWPQASPTRMRSSSCAELDKNADRHRGRRAAAPSLSVMADEAALGSVLVNLMRNAIDAMQGAPQRTLRLEAARRRRRPRDPARQRHRARHPRRHPGAPVRALRHQQAGRRRARARAW